MALLKVEGYAPLFAGIIIIAPLYIKEDGSSSDFNQPRLQTFATLASPTARAVDAIHWMVSNIFYSIGSLFSFTGKWIPPCGVPDAFCAVDFIKCLQHCNVKPIFKRFSENNSKKGVVGCLQPISLGASSYGWRRREPPLG